MQRPGQWNLWILALAVLALTLVQDFVRTRRDTEPLAYSEFIRLVEAGSVGEVTVYPDRLAGEFKSPVEGRSRFETLRVDPELAETLSRFGVKVSGGVQTTFVRDLLSWVVPALVFVGIWLFFIRRMADRGGMGSGLLSIGKSKARVYVETEIKVGFADVAGVDEAKAELEEIVAFLKDPAQLGRLGARIPRGILLVGPPGTGKTLLARAVAGEAGVPFFSINGSEFVEMFVGVGAARVRDLFEQARKRAPAIIFIDEIDALGRARGAFGTGGHDEKEQTLNQLLAELDGFDPSVGLVLLAATNRPDILDPALLRAGRFDRQVLVDRPDKIGRVQILAVHLRRVQLAGDIDREAIAALTPGFSGADLANLVNEAALLATRRGAEAVAMEDFTLAIERIVAGLEKKNRLLNPREREIVAYHEMGHALVALALPGSDKVHKVSIIPRGVGALGYTIQRPTEDRFLMTRGELENKMAVLLGGRAAETVRFGELSTGAADDLAKVTDIARSMVLRFGMDPELGAVAYESPAPPFLGGDAAWAMQGRVREYSEDTARRIDAAVRALVARSFERSVSLLEAQRERLEQGAKSLLERETLVEADFVRLLAEVPAASDAARASERGAPAQRTAS
ncbi:MAG: ATP-dependent zinc metalloprotease FtsH [Burkholderiaceae bacterium]|nr:ATP-dependent zinc metalloprotease FtsH [Burkholderiaceae bacterium]